MNVFELAAKANADGRVLEAMGMYSKIFGNEYEQRIVSDCPLCGKMCDLKCVYEMTRTTNHNPNFSPIKAWRYCADCNHYFSAYLPIDLSATVTAHTDEKHLVVLPRRLNIYGDMLGRLIDYSPSHCEYSILDVGCGGGILLSVALEHGFKVQGVDIREAYTKIVADRLNCPVATMPFEDFETEDKYTFVYLGDVLEHFENPIEAIKKADELGLRLIISTPNADSAFGRIAGHDDPMWRVCDHVNYFTFDSLKILLGMVGRKPLQYYMSKHFNGCMEVVA